MIRGNRLLLPLIKKYKKKMGEKILEIGPFFDPLVIPSMFPNQKIFYFDRDPCAINWLLKKYKGKGIVVIKYNLDRINKKLFENIGYKDIAFDSLIASQVFNYIDYKHFLRIIKKFLRKDALVFINNPIDYGLPPLFSKKRPRSVKEIIDFLNEINFRILENKVIDFFHKNKIYKRVLMVAKN